MVSLFRSQTRLILPLLHSMFRHLVPIKGPSTYSALNAFRKFKKDRPYCTKCQVNGHTIDKCYKNHGYPPGYHHSTRTPSHTDVSSSVFVPLTAVNHVYVITQDIPLIPPAAATFGSLFQTLNSNQCQHLMALFSNQMVSHDESPSQDNSTSSHTTGICFSVVPRSLFSDSRLWIIDFGTS